ncbi:Protein kinase-like domain protein [Niveomyces insectorum RCEF 264]|uniref:EKC/KEOPS complex subunit BUD32 n=1 Tax=Niveomyces insectorum RCEF 264 TaxID=1081102 RepID=A0A162J275_9HYPO|nr:Protein kinase-like domain protein [Niveomyces insectorum RCEF 264]
MSIVEGPKAAEDKRRPKTVRYHPIPGSWERRRHPNWPEKRFQIPEEVPYGTIYYVTKGTFVGFGMTAHIEKTLEGHIVKFPKTNPYDPAIEAENINNMRIEAEIYRRLGDCPHIPKMIGWDPESCCLTLGNLENGNLAYYVKGMRPPDYEEDPPEIDAAIRRRWTIQAAKALKALHAVNVIHSDFTPRNLLLDLQLNIYVSDFAGSPIDGAPYTVYSGERFTVPFWKFDKTPEKVDDIFSLGSVMYVIMTSTEPYHDKDELEVVRLFEEKKFPDVSGIVCGPAIQGCWDGALTTADRVLDLLTALYADFETV